MGGVIPAEPAFELPPALVERFVSHLAGVASEVAALEADLRSSSGHPAAALEGLRAIAHKLAGTARAYGFPVLGDAASALQTAIRADPAGEVAATTLRVSQFSRQLSRAASI